MGPATATPQRSENADTIGGTDASQPAGADTSGVTPSPENPTPVEEPPPAEPVEPAEDSFWFEGGASKYRTPEDAKRGIEEKDRYIAQLVEERDSLRSQASLVDRYKSMVTAEQLVEQRVREKLPEEYRDVKESDFEDEADLRKYLRARVDAELLVEKEDRQAELQAEEQAKATTARQQAAEKFVVDTATPEFFRATNPEDKAAVLAMLDTKGESGFSPLDEAHWIATYVGHAAAQRFLSGVRDSFWSGRRQSVQAIIKERVETVPARPVDPAPPAPRVPVKPDPRTMIKRGFVTTAKPS